MNQKKTSISKEGHNQEKPHQPNSQNSPAVFLGVNVNQLHLTAHDLKGYESAYQGCAKDVLRIIEKTIDNQSKAEESIQKTNQEILSNEKLKIGNFKHKIYLSFFLSALTLIAGCYLISPDFVKN